MADPTINTNTSNTQQLLSQLSRLDGDMQRMIIGELEVATGAEARDNKDKLQIMREKLEEKEKSTTLTLEEKSLKAVISAGITSLEKKDPSYCMKALLDFIRAKANVSKEHDQYLGSKSDLLDQAIKHVSQAISSDGPTKTKKTGFVFDSNKIKIQDEYSQMYGEYIGQLELTINADSFNSQKDKDEFSLLFQQAKDAGTFNLYQNDIYVQPY